MLSLCIIERKCLLKVVTKKVKQRLWIQIFNTNPFTVDFSPEFEILLFPVTSFFTIQCKISLVDMVCFITIFA